MKSLAVLPVLLLAAPSLAQTGGGETRAQAEAKAVALFKRMDADGDGVVTRDEMAAFAAARTGATVQPGAPLTPGAAAMFDDADANGDGKITQAEAVAAALKGFDEADANHDGKVTAAEREAAATRVSADVHGSGPPRETAGPPAPQL